MLFCMPAGRRAEPGQTNPATNRVQHQPVQTSPQKPSPRQSCSLGPLPIIEAAARPSCGQTGSPVPATERKRLSAPRS